jgi:hypothetical protein
LPFGVKDKNLQNLKSNLVKIDLKKAKEMTNGERLALGNV